MQCCLHRWSHTSRPHRNVHIFGVHRYVRAALLVSESVFHVLNDLSRVLSVSRGMRFRQTSTIFWTILSVSRGILNRIPSGFCTSFFPGPHLRDSSTHQAFRVTRKILSHRYAFTWNETTCSCFRCWRSRRKAWLSCFRHLRLLSCCRKMWCRLWCKKCNKLCHSSRVKLPFFVRMSASWFWDSTYLIWTFGFRLILSNNQSMATRWVRKTCIIVGLLPLMTIFITAWLSSKMYNCDSFPERCAFEGTWSTFDGPTFWSNTCLILCASDFYTSFPCARLGWFWFSVSHTQYFNNQIPQVERKKTIHTQTSIQRYDLWFCGAVRHWRLLLAHPTDRYQCSTSKNAQNSAWCWFWVFKIPCQV